MRKVNFNNLDNLEIPDSWADKAVKIPETAKKSPLLFFNKTRSLVAVASIVLVCLVSISAYFLTLNNNKVPIDNKDPVSTQAQVTEDKTSKPTKPEETKEASTANLNTPSTCTPSNNTQETESVTTCEPYEEEKTEDNSSKPSLKPNSKPSANQNQKPTAPTKKPTQKPTQKPTTIQTDNTSQEPSTPPQKPRPTENPDNPSCTPNSVPVCTGGVDEKVLLGSETVYFSIKPKDSIEIESPEAENYYPANISCRYNGIAILNFNPVNSGLVNQSGEYVFYFYNVEKEPIYQDSITIHL